jgi:hypothetical protein
MKATYNQQICHGQYLILFLNNIYLMFTNRKGYRTERKIRIMLENRGWRVIRAGASLGEADLTCIKKGNCILLQIKSSKKEVLYYYGYLKKRLEGFPFYLVVDFGYGKIRIMYPKRKIAASDGESLEDFLAKRKII